MAKVLVVDDSRTDRVLAKSLLECRPGLEMLECRTGLSVLDVAGGDEALEVLQRDLPDLVLTDMVMPGMSGLELVETIRGRFPLLPVILMTAHGSEDITMEALQKGAASYVPKHNLVRSAGNGRGSPAAGVGRTQSAAPHGESDANRGRVSARQ